MTIAAAEERLLPRFGRSAEGELERLYDRHAAEVRRYVQMVLRSRNDSEDVVQQTFLKALRALQRGVRPETPRQWLFAIAHNECRMLFRQNARRPVEVDLEAAGELGAREESGLSAEAIREALGQLAPNQRAALVLRELEDRSYAEIAETLGLTDSAVETLLFRARRAMREQLESQEGGCEDAQLLIASDSLDDADRKRLRAHVRTCAPCGTLERRRRGKLAAAARKVAGLFPAPSWFSSLLGGGGAKAVVAIAVAAVAATGAVEVAKPDSTRPKPAPAQTSARRDLVVEGVSPQFVTALGQLRTVQGKEAPPVAHRERATLVKGAGHIVLAAGVKSAPTPVHVDHVMPLEGALPTSSPEAVGRARPAAPRADTRATPTVDPPAPDARPATQSAPSHRVARRLRPAKTVPAVKLPPLPSMPPVSVPPLPHIDPPQAPALSPTPPSLPEPPALPPLPQTPPMPQLPQAPSVPNVQPPPVPAVQTPPAPALTKP